ncbi:MAG: hypothetical protein ABJP66_24875 [Hyphomicrobiales bacterium]
MSEADLDRHEGNIRATDLVGPVNLHLPQQIRIDRVPRVWLAGSRAFVDSLKTHLGHQSADAMTPHDDPFTAKICRDLTAAKERILREQPFYLFHHCQRVRINPNRCLIKGRPAELHQFALLADAQLVVVALDH